MKAESPVIGVVDDELDLLDLVATILQEEGYTVMCMESPAQAQQLEQAESRPELLVLDIMLPGMTGIELARKLRADGFPNTPMIAISASSSMLRRARDSGLFQDALSKPFDLDTFLGVVEQQLDHAAS